MLKQVKKQKALELYMQNKNVKVLRKIGDNKHPVLYSLDEIFKDAIFLVDEQTTVSDNEDKQSKDIDVGKIYALHQAGWKVADIADELHISKSKVYYQLNKLKQ